MGTKFSEALDFLVKLQLTCNCIFIMVSKYLQRDDSFNDLLGGSQVKLVNKYLSVFHIF